MSSPQSENTPAIHLIKLSVGTKSPDDLRKWQKGSAKRRAQAGKAALPFHPTRMMPRRRSELLKGGSIYWVIQGRIQARQNLLDLEVVLDSEGRKYCHIIMDPNLILTQPVPRRAFQGWRYFEPGEAPPDMENATADAPDLSWDLQTKLMDIGAW